MTLQAGGATAPERLYALDLVRATALLLGILFHISLSFYPGFDFWLVIDHERSLPIAWMGFTLHSFRMATFFMLAGFFGHMMYHRKGPKGFLKNRAARILAPFAVFWPLLLVSYGLAMAYAASVGAMPKTLPSSAQKPGIVDIPLTHLWFLYVLMIFYIATLLIRGIVALIDRNGALRASIDNVLGALIRLPFLLPLLLALPVAALCAHTPDWLEWWGIPTPDRGLWPNTIALTSYGLAFGVGWLIHRLKDGFAPLASFWAYYLVTALVLTVVALALSPTPPIAPQFHGHDRILFAAIYAGMVWFWSLGLIGAALRFITRERPEVRYMADASYWLYLIHLPIIVALQALVAHWMLPAELKLVFIFAVAMAIMLASYHWLIRYSFMGTWLNGKKVRR